MDPAWRPYLLAQLPGWVLAGIAAWVLVQLNLLERWIACAFVIVWVTKDLALFPWMRRFYGAEPLRDRIVGQRGTAVTDVGQKGLVRVHGELWQAQSTRPISEGAPIRVRAMKGLLLQVDADHAGHTQPPGPGAN